jgi:hypothetical protein
LNGPPILKAFSPWKPQYRDLTPNAFTSQRLNNVTSTGPEVLIARDNLKGLAKARFDAQLVKVNKALVECAEQVTEDDLLPTRLPDKVQKPKWAKPRKPHGKASARSYTGAEAAELAANQAEQRSRLAAEPTARPGTPESDIEDVIVPSTAPLAGELQGGTTIALAIRTPERIKTENSRAGKFRLPCKFAKSENMGRFAFVPGVGA